jgi:putative N6-adenine-specific DNA methylase
MRASEVWTFFCVVTPGLEAQALAEYEAKSNVLGALKPARAIAGGFEVELPWEIGRGLTRVLKIPTRVIVRLAQIKARDFPTLFQKTRDLTWGRWLAHPIPRWKVAAHQCRLIHTGRVEETLTEALAAHVARQPFSTRWQKENLAAETVRVRGVDDVWTFSLDITGEALFKRGADHTDAEAPLRETLAAAVLAHLFAGQATPVHLWDPMCGSGTFLREARDFAAASVRADAWEKCALNLGVAPWKPQASAVGFPIASLTGHDNDESLAARWPTLESITLARHDFFLDAAPPSGRPLWVVCNPPYGERLPLAGGVGAFAQRLGAQLGTFSPERVCLVVPQSWPRLEIPGLTPREALPFSNGGIKVEARLWSR